MIAHNPERFQKAIVGEPGNIPYVWQNLKNHVLFEKMQHTSMSIDPL